MAASMRLRRSPGVLVLVICVVFVIILTTTTSVVLADSEDLIYKARPTSSFVRRSLEARKQSGTISSSQTYNPFKVSSSGSVGNRVRRLAGSANCVTNPTICNDVATYGANATCCASTGNCAQLQTDKNNCGFCMYACVGNLGCCGGTCTSTMTDNQNCGTCGMTCKNSLCSSGLCGYGG